MSSSESSSPTVTSPASPQSRPADNQAGKRKAPQAVVLDSTSPSPIMEKRTRGCSSKTPQEPQHLHLSQHKSEENAHQRIFTAPSTQNAPNPQAEYLAMPNELASNVAASTAGRYELNSKYVNIFRGILNKHGDIARNCHPTSPFMLNAGTEAICKILMDLQSKKLSDLEHSDFYAYSSVLKNAEEMGMNVKWLQHRLEELQEASRALVQDNTLEQDRGERMMRLDYLKQALHVKKGESEKIKSEIQQLELQIDIERMAIEDINIVKGSLAMNHRLIICKQIFGRWASLDIKEHMLLNKFAYVCLILYM